MQSGFLLDSVMRVKHKKNENSYLFSNLKKAGWTTHQRTFTKQRKLKPFVLYEIQNRNSQSQHNSGIIMQSDRIGLKVLLSHPRLDHWQWCHTPQKCILIRFCIQLAQIDLDIGHRLFQISWRSFPRRVPALLCGAHLLQNHFQFPFCRISSLICCIFGTHRNQPAKPAGWNTDFNYCRFVGI